MAMAGPYSTVLVAGLLLLMAQQTLQLSLRNPVRMVVDSVNAKNEQGYYGLVLTSNGAETALNNSGLFVYDSSVPYIDASGRRFHIGKLNGTALVYVKTGSPFANIAITVQLLLDLFSIKGIIHYGSAGSVDTELSLADVTVPSYIVLTGNWEWKKYKPSSSNGDLIIGDYNAGEKGNNTLGSIDFESQVLYTPSSSLPLEATELPVTTSWLAIASKLADLELESCVSSNCLNNTPKVVLSGKAASADVYLSNYAYGKFLYSKFGVSTADSASAVVSTVALTNGVPYLVIRAVSNYVGVGSTTKIASSLASTNAFTFAANFLSLVDAQNAN